MKFNGKRIKVLSALLIIAAALYGGRLLLDRADMSMPTLFRPPAKSRLLMSMQGFDFAQSEQGRVVWRMHARTADLYESKEAQLKDLEILFTAPDGREATLIAENGTMDTVSGNAALRAAGKDVRIVTSDGYLLTTSSLFWKAGQRVVSTPDQFKLLGKEIYLEGRGLSGNVDMRTIVVNSNVKAVLQE